MLNTVEDSNEHKNKFFKALNSLEINNFTKRKEWQILKSTSNIQDKLIRNLNINLISTRNNKQINYTYTFLHRH